MAEIYNTNCVLYTISGGSGAPISVHFFILDSKGWRAKLLKTNEVIRLSSSSNFYTKFVDGYGQLFGIRDLPSRLNLYSATLAKSCELDMKIINKPELSVSELVSLENKINNTTVVDPFNF